MRVLFSFVGGTGHVTSTRRTPHDCGRGGLPLTRAFR